MSDTTEAIAARLNDFVRTAQRHAGGSGFQTQVTEMRTRGPKDSLLSTYEGCLSRLTNTQLSELDRILETMSGAFSSSG